MSPPGLAASSATASSAYRQAVAVPTTGAPGGDGTDLGRSLHLPGLPFPGRCAPLRHHTVTNPSRPGWNWLSEQPLTACAPLTFIKIFRGSAAKSM